MQYRFILIICSLSNQMSKTLKEIIDDNLLAVRIVTMVTNEIRTSFSFYTF
jgi:hypothetical protein